MAQRKDRYGFGMDFLSMVPPVVDMQQARVAPGSTYIEFVERTMEPKGAAFWAEDWLPRINSLGHTERKRRLNLRLFTLDQLSQRYHFHCAYDPITRTLYADASSFGVPVRPPICTDEEYRELCALYLEEELKDRVDAARRQTIKDFLVEVNVEKYLRQPLGGR